MSEKDSAEALEDAISRYNDAWNAHDLDAIMAMHAPDMVFENHTAGEVAEGEEVRDAHRRGSSRAGPTSASRAGAPTCRDGLVVQEWTATATHANRCAAATSSPSPPARQISWKGLDVIPFSDGLVKRKDVYSDSVSILRQVGLLE